MDQNVFKYIISTNEKRDFLFERKDTIALI